MLQKINASEFLAMITKNPSVFEHWNSPLEITEFVDCSHTNITHLSPHLTFSGTNTSDKWRKGWVANFAHCSKLQIATGTFHGFVLFSNSGVEKIENLHITKTNGDGWAASFRECQNLEIATGNYPTGNYPGAVDFCKCPKLNLDKLDFCLNFEIEPEKIEAEKKRRASLQKYVEATQIEPLPFL
jgi:hypothetical protein